MDKYSKLFQEDHQELQKLKQHNQQLQSALQAKDIEVCTLEKDLAKKEDDIRILQEDIADFQAMQYQGKTDGTPKQTLEASFLSADIDDEIKSSRNIDKPKIHVQGSFKNPRKN